MERRDSPLANYFAKVSLRTLLLKRKLKIQIHRIEITACPAAIFQVVLYNRGGRAQPVRSVRRHLHGTKTSSAKVFSDALKRHEGQNDSFNEFDHYFRFPLSANRWTLVHPARPVVDIGRRTISV